MLALVCVFALVVSVSAEEYEVSSGWLNITTTVENKNRLSYWEKSWYYSVNKDDMEKGYEVVWGYTE